MNDPNCVDEAVKGESNPFTELQRQKQKNPQAYVSPTVMVDAMAAVEARLARVEDAIETNGLWDGR